MANHEDTTPSSDTPFCPFYPPNSRQKLEFDLSRTLVAAARLWTSLLDGTLKASTGQNRARWATLMWIEFADGPATTMSLAGILKTQWPTIVRTVAALEKEGLVERKENPEDGRSSYLNLTPAGREILYKIPQHIDPVRAEILKDFDDEKLKTMLGMLNSIRDDALKILG